ncbi:MAG: CAP domain-containing protein [Candidatus Peribacteraceae bacterium]|jgi:uncharacterized protein YkwD
MNKMIVALLALAFLSVPAAHAGSGGCAYDDVSSVPRVKMRRVENAWLGWNNRLRRRLDLAPYTLNDALHRTALEWSVLSSEKGSMDHKRTPDAPYYDYKAIEQWFADRGVTFANVNRTTFTENIGWGTYRCTTDDCTSSMIRSIRSTFRFYLAERNKASKPHYNSIVNPYFTQIGLGIIVNPEEGRYYLTVHYGTTVTSAAGDACLSS